MGEDSADEEAFTCLDPVEHDWDEMELGLDDPHYSRTGPTPLLSHLHITKTLSGVVVTP